MRSLYEVPLFARIAIERLDCDSTLRTEPKLNELIDAYACSYRMDVDVALREKTLDICKERFPHFVLENSPSVS